MTPLVICTRVQLLEQENPSRASTFGPPHRSAALKNSATLTLTHRKRAASPPMAFAFHCARNAPEPVQTARSACSKARSSCAPPPPPRAPRQSPRIPLHARLLPRLAPTPSAQAAALRRRAPHPRPGPRRQSHPFAIRHAQDHHHTDHQRPVLHSFKTLLSELATQTRNTIRLTSTNPTFDQLSNPTPTHN